MSMLPRHVWVFARELELHWHTKKPRPENYLFKRECDVGQYHKRQSCLYESLPYKTTSQSLSVS